MKNLLFLLISATFILACGNKGSNTEKQLPLPPTKDSLSVPTIKNNPKSISAFSIIDTLNKYSNVDSLHIESKKPPGILHIGKANEISFAAWLPETNDTTIFYEKIDGKWTPTDTIESLWSFFDVDHMDLNGDGFDDIRLRSYSNSGGNFDNLVFLYKPESKNFKHNADYDVPNITYDEKGGFIKTYWFSGVVHCQDKKRYRISGDHLLMDGGITYCPNPDDEGETATIEYYQLNGNKKKITKKESGKGEDMWKIFETALWDSKPLW